MSGWETVAKIRAVFTMSRGLLERDTEQLDFSDVLDEEDPAQAMEALRLSAPAE